MNTTEIYLLAMGIGFTVPYLIWRLGHTDHVAPLVVVQIITGILLGPGVLGHFFPAYYHFVFNPTGVQSLSGVAWWAVMLFVFLAGIELDLRQTWAAKKESALTAGLALFIPLLFGLYWAKATTQGAICSITLGLLTWLLLLMTPAGEEFPAQLAGVLASLAGMLVGSLAPQVMKNKHGAHHVVQGTHL